MSYEIPKSLIEKIQENNVIPFVGAGVSTGVKDLNKKPLFLDWRNLLLSAAQMLEDDKMDKKANHIRSSIDVAETSEDYLQIADNIEKYLSSRWSDFLNMNFNKNHDEVDSKTLEISREIWNLGNLVITTNYDNVMNWSTNANNLVTWDKKATSGQVASLKELPQKNTLWHLHGRIDNLDNIVLTSKSYEEVYKEDSGAIEVLKFHMLTKSFIFLGFSLDDLYLKEQLKKIKGLFGNNLSRHYILIKENNTKDLSELGDIQPIYIKNYTDGYLQVLKKLTQYKEELVITEDTKIVQSIDEELPIFNVPFKSKKDGAIGIEDKLLEVHQVLEDTAKTNIDQLASFQGMGGLGKTQLAVEYAYKYRDEYSGVIWLTIDQDIDEQLLDLAQKYSWVNRDIENKTKLEIIKKKIFGLTDILFIFDNVDNRDEIKEFYEQLSNNKILITSRNAIQGFKSIPLDTLNKDNSLKLLSFESNRDITNNELEYAIKIFNELDGLPLALEMAGSYVEYLGLDWKDYYELYKEKGVSFLEESDIRSFTNHEVNIAKTLSLSNTLLDKEPLLESIIYLLAWGASESIDKYLISILLKEKKINLVQPIKMGVKLKFLKESDDGYTLHRLVKDIYRAKKPLDISFATKTSQNLANYMKEIKDDFLKLRELDKASFQAKSWAKKIEDKYLKASLINYSVYPDYHRGKYKIALENINSVFELFENDTDSDIYAELLNNKGFLTDKLGDAKEAKPYFEKALEMRKQLYPNLNHPNIANSLSNMGSVLDSLGERKEAKIYYEKSLEMSEKLYPNSNHPNIASSLNNMGFVLDSLGETKEAKIYYEKALEMSEKLYPNSNHPNIASSLNNMGFVLDSLGETKEAKIYYEKALEMRENLYPNSNHPDIANSLNGMGSILVSLGESEEAKDYFEKALEMREKLYPNSNHPDIANSLHNMSTVFYKLKDLTLAKDYSEKAYIMGEKIYGKNHKDTVNYMLGYVFDLNINPQTKAKAISILKEFKKVLKNNKKLLSQVQNRLNEIEPNIGRNKSKRKRK